MVLTPMRWQNVLPHWRKLALVAGAIGLALLTSYLAVRLESRYLERNSYFYDAAYYQQYNLNLLEQVHQTGRLSVAWDQWVHNDRHPLRTVPIILVAPHLLGRPFGHLATIVPTLTLLLGLFGYTVYKRTQSSWLVMGGMSLLAAVPIFFDVHRGIANYWLEWGATIWLGIAVLCLWNVRDAKRPQLWGWFIGFGIAAACAMLSRYIAGVFVFVVCAPVYLLSLWYTWRSQKCWQAPVIALGVTLGALLSCVGYFAFAHFSSNAAFYETYGYAINQTFASSRDFIFGAWQLLWHVQNRTVEVYLAGFVGLGALLTFTTLRLRSVLPWLIALLSALAVPITLIAMGTVGAVHPLVYAIVPTLLFVVAPVAFEPKRWQHQVMLFAGVAGMLLAMFVYYNTYEDIKKQGLLPVTGEKQFVVGLVDELALVSNNVGTWQSYFEEYSDIPTLEFYYRYNRLIKPAGQRLFYSQTSAWKGDYPNLSDEQIAELVYQQTLEQVDIAVVFVDPDQGRLNGWMLNQTSRFVSSYVAKRIQSDPNFKLAFTYQNNFYGALAAYRNLARDQRN